jgi:hypothetical protein
MERLMKTKKWISLLIVILTIVISAIGVFSKEVEVDKTVMNAYGDEVELYGQGIYAFESAFKAPILKGTDFALLVLIVPGFVYFEWISKMKPLKKSLVILGFLTSFMYYSSALAFGVSYNNLILLYIALFSLVFFKLWDILAHLDFKEINKIISGKLPPKGVRIFLVIAGSSVLIWLVEIINTFFTGRPPIHIGLSTTEPTFIKDLALILPLCWLSSYWIGKKKAIGVVIGSMMLILCGAIGLIVISQSVFQYLNDVIVSVREGLLFVVPFVVLSVLSAFFVVKLLKWGIDS